MLCVLCPEDRRVVVGVLSLPTLAPAGWLECGYTLTRDQGREREAWKGEIT